MVIQPLDMKKDSFCPREKDENLLGPKRPHLSAISALMDIADYTI